MQIEVWKNIKGYQGLYQASNLGNIKSLKYRNTNKEKILKHYLNIRHNKNRDYVVQQIELYKNGKRKHYYIHRLVYQAFIGKIPNGFQIDHRDNNPENNRLDNLQLLTKSENLKKIYIDNPNYKNGGGLQRKKIICLNDNQIYESINDAARKLNLYSTNICKVLKGKYKQTQGYSFTYVDEQTEDKQ